MADIARAPRKVEWESNIFGSQPRWTTEPSLPTLEQLARNFLHLPADIPCKIAIFAQGGFNKLYTIEAPGHAYLIRVVLPVEPRLKTLSEVATIAFVREHVTERVPRILAYDADADADGLGYEWMIMERLPGRVLEEQWKDMRWEAKEQLVKTLVGILSRLYDHRLSGIGNIYPRAVDVATHADISPDVSQVGPIVSMGFFWHKHYDQDVPRGPFRSSHDWLAASMAFILSDAADTLRTSDDEDDREEAEATQTIAERLVRLLPAVFPPQDAFESTIIHHDDLSFHNLLVDDTGELTGIVDWECVSALPLWKACQLPSFLVGNKRTERPDRSTYAVNEDGSENEIYVEHLREWEQTQLRKTFLDEMQRIQPAWIAEHRAAVLKADFEAGVMYCDGEFTRGLVRRWLDRVEQMGSENASGYVSLRDQLFLE